MGIDGSRMVKTVELGQYDFGSLDRAVKDSCQATKGFRRRFTEHRWYVESVVLSV